MCEREREREREREKERERKKERGRERGIKRDSVCVCGGGGQRIVRKRS